MRHGSKGVARRRVACARPPQGGRFVPRIPHSLHATTAEVANRQRRLDGTIPNAQPSTGLVREQVRPIGSGDAPRAVPTCRVQLEGRVWDRRGTGSGPFSALKWCQNRLSTPQTRRAAPVRRSPILLVNPHQRHRRRNAVTPLAGRRGSRRSAHLRSRSRPPTPSQEAAG